MPVNRRRFLPYVPVQSIQAQALCFVEVTKGREWLGQKIREHKNMAYIQFITINELQDRTPAELQHLLKIAYAQMGDFEHHTEQDRHTAVEVADNIVLVLGVKAAVHRWAA